MTPSRQSSVLTSRMLKVEPTEPPLTQGRKRRRPRNADGEIKVEDAKFSLIFRLQLV